MKNCIPVRQCRQCSAWIPERADACPACRFRQSSSEPGAAVSEMAERGQEARLQHECEAWLSYRGVEHLHLSPRAREHAGWPDLTFAIAGTACGVELKTRAGKLSLAQSDCLSRLRDNGWRTAVCRSLDELRDFVRDIEHQTDM